LRTTGDDAISASKAQRRGCPSASRSSKRRSSKPCKAHAALSAPSKNKAQQHETRRQPSARHASRAQTTKPDAAAHGASGTSPPASSERATANNVSNPTQSLLAAIGPATKNAVSGVKPAHGVVERLAARRLGGGLCRHGMHASAIKQAAASVVSPFASQMHVVHSLPQF
jgi:hypothetical protein